jgi:hypothetical protein
VGSFNALDLASIFFWMMGKSMALVNEDLPGGPHQEQEGETGRDS